MATLYPGAPFAAVVVGSGPAAAVLPPSIHTCGILLNAADSAADVAGALVSAWQRRPVVLSRDGARRRA